jgi:hypothetical protein
MATPVQRATAIIGACRNEETPSAQLLLTVGDAVAVAKGFNPADLTNAQKGALFVSYISEQIRVIVNRAALPDAERAAREQVTAATAAQFPEVP